MGEYTDDVLPGRMGGGVDGMPPEPSPVFRPGELEEICSLVHTLFSALPSTSAELVLRACWRAKWAHLSKAHMVHALERALEQSRWRR